MRETYKILVVADDSEEFPNALAFACLSARALGATVVVLKSVEAPLEGAQWVSVGEDFRAEAREEAEANGARIVAEAQALHGVTPVLAVREEGPKAALRRMVDEDEAVRLVVLGAGVGRDGPGPLISSFAGGKSWGRRAAPLLVVPAGLSLEEVRRLAPTALPGSALPSPP